MKHLLGILLLTVLVFLVVVTGAIAMSPDDFPGGFPTPEGPPEVDDIIANLDIYPGTINLKSNGQYIDAYIELPPDYEAADIDIRQGVALAENVASPENCLGLTEGSKVGDKDNDGIADLRVRFDRKSLRLAVVSTGMVELTISGLLSDGTTSFVGSDVVKIIR